MNGVTLQARIKSSLEAIKSFFDGALEDNITFVVMLQDIMTDVVYFSFNHDFRDDFLIDGH